MTDWADPGSNPMADMAAAVATHARAARRAPWPLSVLCATCGKHELATTRIWGSGGVYIRPHLAPTGARCLGDTRTDHAPMDAA